MSVGRFVFFFLHNGLASKWLFWFVFCLLHSLLLSRVTSFFIISYHYYRYCYYYCTVTPKFRSSYHELHDSFGTLLDCIGGFQIKLVLAQIITFFSFFFFSFLCPISFPLLSLVALGYICFAPFVVRDSKRLFFSFSFFFFLSFFPQRRVRFFLLLALKIFRFRSPSKLFSTFHLFISCYYLHTVFLTWHFFFFHFFRHFSFAMA